MKLSKEQEKNVCEFVEEQGLKIKTLKEDLIDHICCVIEYEIGKGLSFEQAFKKGLDELAPQGLKSLENKTIFLLNSKRILMMKRLLYLTGLIGAISLTAGAAFKLLRMPYGSELFIVGFLIMMLIFIPLLAIDMYKVAISKALSERLKIIIGVTAAITVGLSGLFKILHLQGAEMLLMAGSLIFAIGFLPFLFFSMYKKSVR